MKDENQKDDFVHLSWGARNFIARPSSSLLFMSLALIFVSLFVFVGASFLIEVENTVRVEGITSSKNGILKIKNSREGILQGLSIKSDQYVTKGQVLGHIGLSGRERDLTRTYIKSLKNILSNCSPKICKDLNLDIQVSEVEDLKLAGILLDIDSEFKKYKLLLPKNISTDRALLTVNFIQKVEYGVLLLKDILKKSTIKSPVNGKIVKTLKSVGSTLGRLDVVAHILPEYSPLIIKSYLASDILSSVSVGHEVKIELSSFPASEYGYFDGKISKINKVNHDKKDHSVEILIEFSSTKANSRTVASLDDKTINISLGLEVDARIILGKSKLAHFLKNKFF